MLKYQPRLLPVLGKATYTIETVGPETSRVRLASGMRSALAIGTTNGKP